MDRQLYGAHNRNACTNRPYRSLRRGRKDFSTILVTGGNRVSGR